MVTSIPKGNKKDATRKINMKKEIITKDGNTIFKNTFDSLADIIKYIQETEVNQEIFGSFSGLSSEMEGSEFSGTESLEETIQYCLYGVKNQEFQEFLQLEKVLKEELPHLTQNRKNTIGSYGFRPSVQKYLMGNPKSMYQLTRKENYQFLDILFMVTARNGETRNQILNRGIITLELIQLLEQMGYRINLDFVDASFVDQEYIYNQLNIKKAREKLDTHICYFPMCHPAFLRRILFRVKETMPVTNPHWDKSYGYIIQPEKIEEVLEQGKDKIIIYYSKELGIEGKDIVEDFKNFWKNLNEQTDILQKENLTYDDKTKKFVLTKNKNQ